MCLDCPTWDLLEKADNLNVDRQKVDKQCMSSLAQVTVEVGHLHVVPGIVKEQD